MNQTWITDDLVQFQQAADTVESEGRQMQQCWIS